MILFIHGFKSCGLGNKSKALIDFFGLDNVIAPDLPFKPKKAIEKIEEIKKNKSIDLLVGSSLGGFYATWINSKIYIPSVLINPAVAPFASLSNLKGEHTDCYGLNFTLTDEDIDYLGGLCRENLSDQEKYLVLLQTGDEVLNYNDAADFYKKFDVIIENGGNHRFENFENQCQKISEWLNK